MPRLHPRTLLVSSARAQIDAAVSSAIEEHSLTFGEVLSILSELLTRWSQVLVREERNPTNKLDRRAGRR